jgi:hypothetical protein
MRGPPLIFTPLLGWLVGVTVDLPGLVQTVTDRLELDLTDRLADAWPI